MIMSKKIIINADDDIPDSESLFYVQNVVKDGLVSGNNDCYCYITKYSDGTHVSCDKTKTGFSFRVWRQ